MIADSSFTLHHQPRVLVSSVVAKQSRGAIEVIDQDVEISVVVEIAVGGPAADIWLIESWTPDSRVVVTAATETEPPGVPL